MKRLASSLHAVLASLWLSSLPAAAQPRDEQRPAHGLIVRLHADDARLRSATTAAPESLASARRTARNALERAGLSGWSVRTMNARTLLVSAGQLLPPAAAREAAERLAEAPGIAWVEPNVRERRLQDGAPRLPDDPYFSQQWWLRAVSGSDADAYSERLRGVPGLQSAWSATTGGSGALIAVLDTGYTDHPELAARVRPGYDFVSEIEYANDGDGRDADPHDPGDWVSQTDRNAHPAVFGDCAVAPSSWHGTAILGQLAARTANGAGMAALRWSGDVLAVRVAGKCGATVADVVDAIRWSAGLHVEGVPDNPTPVRVISLSFGGDAPCSEAYREAIEDAARAGALLVASAGNDSAAVSRPANCRGALGVAALNRDGFKAYYSNFGPSVGIATVGGDYAEGRWGPMLGDGGLLSLYNDGKQGPLQPQYALFAGTSFAAPIVAGTVALMLDLNPQLSVADLIDGIERSARPHVSSNVLPACSAQAPTRCICAALGQCGSGILDAPEALRFAVDPAGFVARSWSAPLLDGAELHQAIALGSDNASNEQVAGLDDAADGGGGAMGAAWIAALLAAVLALRLSRSRRD